MAYVFAGSAKGYASSDVTCYVVGEADCTLILTELSSVNPIHHREPTLYHQLNHQHMKSPSTALLTCNSPTFSGIAL